LVSTLVTVIVKLAKVAVPPLSLVSAFFTVIVPVLFFFSSSHIEAVAIGIELSPSSPNRPSTTVIEYPLFSFVRPLYRGCEHDVDFVLVPTADPSVSTRDVPAGTYKLSETELDGYTTVLIAGDTGCPSMVDEVFTIKKGKDLSCIIYNDDNFNGDGTSDGDGIFFVRNSIPFDPATSGTCTKNAANVINNSPCIVVDLPTLFIADPTLDDSTMAPTAIITSTIIQITTGNLSPPQCVFLGVSEMFGVVGFGMDCQGIQTDGSTYNANYAIIDASP